MTFSAAVDELLTEHWQLDPVHATEIGVHDHDGRWPDLSPEGRKRSSEFLARAEAALAAVDRSGLTRDEAIDLRVLSGAVAAWRFFDEDLDEIHWNPLVWVYLSGGGLFYLLSREFAPLPDRLRSVAGRLRALPALLDQARVVLREPAARTISQFHAEKAVERMPGVLTLVESAVEEARGHGDAALTAEVEAAAAEATAAITAFTDWMREEVLPLATGDFQLGPKLYANKFRHALRTDMSPEEAEARATRAFHEVRSEMERVARDLWPAWMADAPIPADSNDMIRAVLDAIATDHPKADELLDFCREENARIEAFVAERDLVGLADEPLKIIWTPSFLRAFGGAMLIPPGPLDRGQNSYFAITPMPDDWTDEQRESYLREDNARMLRLLTIHEAVPGHYLQLAYSNRTDSLVRAMASSGVFAEGWACYITQVMMDVGYGAEDPALMLVHWKFWLRAITNTLIDLRIHAGNMNRDEAMSLMVDDGFQEEAEAANKWDRARLSSTQLCEYFIGQTLMTDLETEARRRAAAAGDEFVWRPFLESVLAHGTPPMPIIRDILFGEA
jgi:uncharacterized protein (DUF885 family)